MRYLLSFFSGILLGWLIDQIYWRDRRLLESNRVTQSGDDSSQLRQKLAQAEAEISRLQAELAAPSKRGRAAARQGVRDQLEKISGIGPVFARKLNEADINTFVDLANSTPQRIHDIIQPENWQKIEPEKWIAQAQELTQTNKTHKE